MRRAVLLRSVQRVLGDGAGVRDAAYVWTRHRWSIPFAAMVFAGIALVAPIADIEDWPTRIVLGLAGVAVAVNASTTYRVLAETDDGIVLLKASRIRQVATGVEQKLPANTDLKPVGGTIIATDWLVGNQEYTAPRSSEQAMQRMAASRP